MKKLRRQLHQLPQHHDEKVEATKKERENERERASTLNDKREREREREIKKLKVVTIQGWFCKNHLCFEVFKNGFVKTVFEMFIIFTKLPLLYKRRWFFNNHRRYYVVEKSFFSSDNK